jgi:hypothetical protein
MTAPILPPAFHNEAPVVRIKSGPDWVDVRLDHDGRLFLVAYNLGPDADAAEARMFADELRHGPKGIMAGLDDAGPWVDEHGEPIPGQFSD